MKMEIKVGSKYIFFSSMIYVPVNGLCFCFTCITCFTFILILLFW